MTEPSIQYDESDAYDRTSQLGRQFTVMSLVDPHLGDQFGTNIDIAGNYAIVSAHLAEKEPVASQWIPGTRLPRADHGRAYIFQWTGMEWREVARLSPQNPDEVLEFGQDVAIADGYAVVTVRSYTSEREGRSSTRYNVAYLFSMPEGGWEGDLTETAVLTPSVGVSAGSPFSAVAAEGDVVLIGAPYFAHLENPESTARFPRLLHNIGTVYVFERPIDGWVGTVNQVSQLHPSDKRATFTFGTALDIYDDTVVVGSSGYDMEAFETGERFGGPDNGAVYVYTRPEEGWIGDLYEKALLVPSEPSIGLNFGSEVAMSDDAVVVSSWSNEAHVFVRSESGWIGRLNEDAILMPHDRDTGRFGIGMAMDGETIVVSGIENVDDEATAFRNLAYVFFRPRQGWVGDIAAEVTLGHGAKEIERFGASVAVLDQLVLVGAPFSEGVTGPTSGAVYSYILAEEHTPRTIDEHQKFVGSAFPPLVIQ